MHSPMTVKELRDLLKPCDGSAVVMIQPLNDGHGGEMPPPAHIDDWYTKIDAYGRRTIRLYTLEDDHVD